MLHYILLFGEEVFESEVLTFKDVELFNKRIVRYSEVSHSFASYYIDLFDASIDCWNIILFFWCWKIDRMRIWTRPSYVFVKYLFGIRNLHLISSSPFTNSSTGQFTQTILKLNIKQSRKWTKIVSDQRYHPPLLFQSLINLFYLFFDKWNLQWEMIFRKHGMNPGKSIRWHLNSQ